MAASLLKVVSLGLLAGEAALPPLVLGQALAEETVWPTVPASGLAVAWEEGMDAPSIAR